MFSRSVDVSMFSTSLKCHILQINQISNRDQREPDIKCAQRHYDTQIIKSCMISCNKPVLPSLDINHVSNNRKVALRGAMYVIAVECISDFILPFPTLSWMICIG